jgi:branched-chain amino acid transport system permease protein
MHLIESSVFTTSLINGLCLSGIYILIALGITLILSIMNILQFAHGEIYMLGAFVTYFVVVRLGGNVFLAIFISMIVTGTLGFILERLLFRPLMGKFLPIVCATTGLMLMLQTGAVLTFGLGIKHLPAIWPGTLKFLNVRIPYDRLIALLVSIGLTSIVFLFLKRTRLGQAIMATAQNREGALLVGINPNMMYMMVMVIGSALASVAGAFAGAIFLLDPFMGSTALMKGFTIIVIGGMGSLSGVILGGLALGISDGLTPALFGQEAATIVPLVIVIIILITRPKGLFGHE